MTNAKSVTLAEAEKEVRNLLQGVVAFWDNPESLYPEYYCTPKELPELNGSSLYYLPHSLSVKTYRHDFTTAVAIWQGVKDYFPNTSQPTQHYLQLELSQGFDSNGELSWRYFVRHNLPSEAAAVGTDRAFISRAEMVRVLSGMLNFCSELVLPDGRLWLIL